jgi:hypothetical protein
MVIGPLQNKINIKSGNLTSMPKIKIRPADMAKIHRTKPPGQYGPCEFHYCGCPEFQDNPEFMDDCANCHHSRRYHTKMW